MKSTVSGDQRYCDDCMEDGEYVAATRHVDHFGGVDYCERHYAELRAGELTMNPCTCGSDTIEIYPLLPGDGKLDTTGDLDFTQRYRCTLCGRVCWVQLAITSLDWSN